MGFKISEVLSVFLIVLTLCCPQKAPIVQAQELTTSWLPSSDVRIRNLKKVVLKHVAELAQKDNYFPSSLITTYVDGVMNSLNQNGGRAVIIAHDGMQFTKFTFILGGNGNTIETTATHYAKNFGDMFAKNKIEKSEWLNLIHQLNTLGCAVAVADGSVKYSYNFKEDKFSITHTTYQSK
ncbi:MAG TPA: hypothetical protein VEF33_13880 [Syntrophales bacterium]|nr:hypothetical protein [Syntrophales bacterium]